MFIGFHELKKSILNKITMTGKKRVDEEGIKVGPSNNDALYTSKWTVGIDLINQIKMNLATRTYCGYYQTSNIGPSLLQ